MIGRATLVAFAKGEAPETAIEAIKQAILCADRVAADDVEGDGEHVAFERALLAGLDVTRPTGRPRNDSIPLRELTAFMRARGTAFTETSLKKALSRAFNVSEGTALARIKDARRERNRCRERIAALLDSRAAEQGQRLMDAAIARRHSLAE